MERIIVRRGRVVTYELLRKIFGGDPNIEIIWDRRRLLGSALEGAPNVERRSRPPEQWYQLDYLFTSGGRATFPPLPAVVASGDPHKPPSE